MENSLQDLFTLEPKPERLVVAVMQGHPFHAEAGKISDYWRERLSWVLPSKPDLILVPEGANQRPSGQEPDDTVREVFRQTAEEAACFVGFPGMRRVEGGKWANSLELFDRRGRTVGIYDKNFTAISEMECGRIAGQPMEPWKTSIGKIAPLICWDLNFYQDFPHYEQARPDILLFASRYHGGLMQRFWAYQCRSWFLSAFAFGECTVINPIGEVVARTTNYTSYVTAVINLDYQVVHLGDGNMPRLKQLKAKYGRGVTITDPGYLGPVLVTSELNGVSSLQMIREFGMETWDEYFQRSRQAVLDLRR